jgi:hypothetical protein
MRFTLENQTDRRIYSTLFPNNAEAISKGDEIVMLVSPQNASQAIVAELYEDVPLSS